METELRGVAVSFPRIVIPGTASLPGPGAALVLLLAGLVLELDAVLLEFTSPATLLLVVLEPPLTPGSVPGKVRFG